jgi:YtkA-like
MSHRSPSKVIGFTGLATALLLVAACGQPSGGPQSDPVVASGDPSMTIAFKTLAAPTKGGNKIEAVVKRTDGTPVTDAAVAVTFRMPAMPSMNMPEMHSTTSLTHEADGRYVGMGELEMAGTWNVTVTVSREGVPPGSGRFTVIAR